MAKKTQRDFSSGEVTPDIFGRSDFVTYKTGLKTLKNAYVRRHGSIERRPGAEYHEVTKNRDEKVRLLPFTFSRDISYVIELGDGYFRVLENGSYFTFEEGITPSDPSGVTNEVNPQFSLTTHNFSLGDEFFASFTFANETIPYQLWTVSEVVDANNFKIVDRWGQQIDTTSSGSYVSGDIPQRILTIDTDFNESQLFDIRYTQSADVLTLTHRDVGVYNIKRVSDGLIPPTISFEIEKVYFYPDIASPQVALKTPSPASTDSVLFSYRYYATAISPDTGKESLASFFDFVNVNKVDAGDKIRITVSRSGTHPVPVPQFVNIYRKTFDSGSTPKDYEFAGTGFMTTLELKTVGSVVSRDFIDDGSITPDTSRVPPLPSYVYGETINYTNKTQAESDLSFFDNFLVNNHPNAITTSKQRRFIGGSNNKRDIVSGSALSQFEVFDEPYIGTTIATSPLEFNATTEIFGRVQHLVDWKRLFVFTDVAEFVAQGGESGAISATDLPNAEKISENGANNLRPIIAEKSIVYCQAQGSLVRTLGGQITRDNYQGDELSIFSSHLIDGYELIDWTYQKTPHGIIWVVRDDGILLSLTYNENQAIKGWARHEFQGGKVKSVCTVPEGNIDKTYVAVERTINSQVVNYIESFDTREITDNLEYNFADSAYKYDGRNTDTSLTMTLTDALFEYSYLNDLTLTASAAYFESSDVGQSIFLYNQEGDVLRCEITAFTSSTVVTVRAHKDADLFLVPTSNWSKALKTIKGLYHLEREKITAYGDGFVKANELNPEYTEVTVRDGEIELDTPSAVFSIGKAIVSDIEPLEIDTGAEYDSTEDEKFNPNYVVMRVRNTGAVYVGYKKPLESEGVLEGLSEVKIRKYENYDEPVHLRTGILELNIEATFTEEGRVFIRQIDPLPLRILSIGVSGEI